MSAKKSNLSNSLWFAAEMLIIALSALAWFSMSSRVKVLEDSVKAGSGITPQLKSE